ncbi:MAG: 50S ribosomal protein L18 [Nitrospirae bacterium]|jgi:large subunit ribosomal protein L18|uniref:Large ribosomal subunit protein uL18 n=1 Tax=Leptospirillum ferrodiazotrophum TaxID=412449 RepID=C6HW94_9BACT|nr:MAG: ribosomal protein L18 [Leptospirillum ferrodiazotrophum]MCL5953775.1 50S ribosomal protein L18 [Nitrospirota bacterium]
MKLTTRNEKRLSKHARVRKKIKGSPERPRLSVYRSLKYIYAQIIDDTTGSTLVSASSLTMSEAKSGDTVDVAKKVGEVLATEAKKKNITSVVFDRGGYLYHGRIKALADGARSGGLQF